MVVIKTWSSVNTPGAGIIFAGVTTPGLIVNKPSLFIVASPFTKASEASPIGFPINIFPLSNAMSSDAFITYGSALEPFPEIPIFIPPSSTVSVPSTTVASAKLLKSTSLPVVKGVEIVRILVFVSKFIFCSSFWLSPSPSL